MITAFDGIHAIPIDDTGGLQGNRCSQPKTVTQTGKTFAVYGYGITRHI